jgi:hypothetical protein
VPLVIVSAAISDVVEGAIDYVAHEVQGIKRDLVHVIANQSSKCPITKQIIGFKDPLMHTCNKDEVVHQYFKNSKDTHETDLLKRHNVIVMGDLIDDIKMAKYLHEHDDDILSVGFFNNPKKDGEQLLREYEKHFDMVVVNDGNLHFLHYFLDTLARYEGKNLEKASDHILHYEDLRDH